MEKSSTLWPGITCFQAGRHKTAAGQQTSEEVTKIHIISEADQHNSTGSAAPVILPKDIPAPFATGHKVIAAARPGPYLLPPPNTPAEQQPSRVLSAR